MKKTFPTKTGRKVFLWHDGRTHRIKANVRGTVVRRSSIDPDEAIAIARSLAEDIDKGIDPDLQLTMRQRCEYLEAIEQLGTTAKLKDAVEFYLKHHSKSRGTLESLRPLLLESLRKGGRTDKRIATVSKVFDELIARFRSRPMDTITPEEIEKYHTKFKHPVTRRGRELVVSQIWNFAQKHDHVSYAVPTAASKVTRIPVPHKDPVLCPTPLLKNYLKHAKEHYPDLVPMIAIAAFAGVRTSEISRLKWSDIDMEGRYIRLSSDITKTRRRRLVPMPANLYEWLVEPHKKSKPSSAVAPKRPENHTRFLRTRFSLPPIPPNSLRHTAATMLIAGDQKMDNVAKWLGNSVDVLEVHYKGLATVKDAMEYFDIYPEDFV